MLSIPEYKNAEKVFYFFEEISKIPHISTNTAPIAEFLVNFAKERGLACIRDRADNVIIKKAATKGLESRPAVILQGHTDMVADKVPECTLDLDKDGLNIYRDGDFIRAEGTTLGADDGVAVAYMLALLDSSDIAHPALEALFTSDEEIGLIGATALDTSSLSGRTLINIDSDVEGIFTVGCAGGLRVDVALPYKPSEKSERLYKISVKGLLGGHSGMEIDKGRINAIKVLAEILGDAKDVRIADISGGNADNAIPRTAECVFEASDVRHIEEKLIPSIRARYIKAEPDISVTIETHSASLSCFDFGSSRDIIEIISKMPTGVYKMSEDALGMPETSSNLGIVKYEGERVKLALSVRSSKNAEKDKLTKIIKDIAEEFSAETLAHGEYPAWEYKKESHLRDTMVEIYRREYKKEPTVVTIHAGLECGIFSDKIDGLDCVSIGPDNFDIHTAEERLSISSTARVWEFLKTVLKEI